jgi:3-oxoacyl-[acyl-carrier-protein] synthase II
MTATRVVITGIGLVTPVGIGVDPSWRAIQAGVSSAGPITAFDASAFDARFACQINDFVAEDFIDKRQAKHLDRYAQLALAAAKYAMADSGLEVTDDLSPMVGVAIGSGIGGMNTWEKQHAILLEKGPNRVSPFLIPMLIADTAAGMVSIAYNAQGPNLAVVTACASSAHSIGESAEMIRRGAAVAMITGGAEATITPLGVAGFASMKALSFRNDDPQRASRPFDRGRDGFVMGEGSGILVLENYDHARARGAKIYGEILGYGASGDAHHMTAPHPCGTGIGSAMQRAMRQAGLAPEQIAYVNAHGTSTPANDRIESLALRNVFGAHADRLAVSSTKSMTGHLLGAAGAVELIFCVLGMRDNVLPPTINYEDPDPECDLDYVPNEARPATYNIAMSNSLGFGGHNASLIVGKV